MPVECAVELGELSKDEFRELDYLVMRKAFDSQNELGRLADERIYQADLKARLRDAGLKAQREVSVQISHRDFCKVLKLDLLVADSAVYELKVATSIADAHRGQLLNYLQLLDQKRGKLVNFGARSVESEFVNAAMSSSSRRDFTLDDSGYTGKSAFLGTVSELVRDWGTSLTLSLYEAAITHFLGGDLAVKRMIPLRRNNMNLGNQEFMMISDDVAFRLTSINKSTSGFREQLHRILTLSPLKCIHWINVAHHDVNVATVTQ
jgi:GxxExxY protein